MENHSDQEWIRLLKQDNHDALHALWELLCKAGATIAWRWGIDEEIGLNVALKAYELITHRGIFQFKFESKFSSYCWTIVIREVLRARKREEKSNPPSRPMEEVKEPRASEPPIHPEKIVAILRSCLDKLPTREYIAFTWYYFAEKTQQEIADELKVLRGNANIITHRARKKMKECLNGRGFYSSEDVLENIL